MSLPVAILCGGRGIQIDESGRRWSKALVPVRGTPMVIHLISHYVAYGYREFILGAGLQHQELREAVIRCTNGREDPGTGAVLGRLRDQDIRIQLVETGPGSLTGERIRAISHLLGEPPEFALTYSDTLANVNFHHLLRFHRKHGRLATLVSARMPTRFRVLGLRFGEHQVRGFADKAVIRNDWINGGFYFFRREILGPDYLGNPLNRVLETQVLEKLVERQELMAFPCQGSWQHLDSERDLARLEQIAGELE